MLQQTAHTFQNIWTDQVGLYGEGEDISLGGKGRGGSGKSWGRVNVIKA